MSRYCISDIHGCLKTFDALLKEIKFKKTDKLYIIGDMIDRGSDSAGVIQRILDLRSGGYSIECLMGNHELMLLESAKLPGVDCYTSDAAALWARNGSISTLKSYDIQPKDYDNFWECIPQSHRDFFKSLKYFKKLKNYILVHAGLKFEIDTFMELIYGLPKLPPITNPLKQTSEYDMVWARYVKVKPELMGGRILITGHTPLPLFDSIFPMQLLAKENLHIIIDSGCWYAENSDEGFGYLVALNLDNLELFWSKNCE